MALYFVFLLITYQKRTLKSEASYGNSKSLKNDEKYFFFNLKNSIPSQDIKGFVFTFCSYRKTA